MSFLSRVVWRRISRLANWLRNICVRPQFSIRLDYPIRPSPRYGYGRPMHARLLQLIEARRTIYCNSLESLLVYKSDLWQINTSLAEDAGSPAWINGYLTAFDAVSLYGLIRLHRPRLYIEIGSGHSTRFARRAVQDEHIDTTIVCIDPRPRTEIRTIADRLIEQPVEQIELDIFESLKSGDILFVDHSHRVFTNSDATVVFLDILPRLNTGVLVHFHDIFLPSDYPPEWNERYYSEQYLLACHLLAPAQSFEILLANSFVSGDPALNSILTPLWRHPVMQGVETHGCSFWVQIKEPPGLGV
jgi:predicted O-methyltransferase YrrM